MTLWLQGLLEISWQEEALWAGGVTQVVERLPSKCEALSSNPNTVKKKEGGFARGFLAPAAEESPHELNVSPWLPPRLRPSTGWQVWLLLPPLPATGTLLSSECENRHGPTVSPTHTHYCHQENSLWSGPSSPIPQAHTTMST
jgi:hypothetical protein